MGIWGFPSENISYKTQELEPKPISYLHFPYFTSYSPKIMTGLLQGQMLFIYSIFTSITSSQSRNISKEIKSVRLVPIL